MVTSRVELLMSRRQYEALIKADPIFVAFTRRPKVSVPGGGWRWGTEVTLELQEVTLIPFKRRMVEFLVNTELGDVVDLPYVLVGRHDLDIKPKDTFTVNGETFEVKTVDLKREARTAAHVDYYGASDG